jgi:hypothetical protein
MEGDRTVSTPTKLLGPNELRPLLRQVIDANPDAVNPRTNHNWCLYTDPDDPKRHCIIGQLALNQGWTVPGPEIMGAASSVVYECGWPVSDDGGFYLDDIQMEIDNKGQGPLGRWKKVKL